MTKKTIDHESLPIAHLGLPQLNRAQLADALLSSSLDCIIVSDAQGRVVEFNAEAERVFGWTRMEVLGKKMEETVVPPVHREAHRKGMERFLAGGAPRVLGKRVEMEALNASGEIFPIELSISETTMGDDRYFVATLRDLSKQKKAAAQLQETQATLKAIFDNIPAALYLRDRDDKLVMINNWGADFLGHHPDQMIGQPMIKFREPQNMERVKEVDENIVRTGQPVTDEFTYHLAGGDKIGQMTFFPVFGSAGDVTHIGGMLTDVTELHKARMDLHETRANLQSMFDNVPTELYLRELDGRFIMMNRWGMTLLRKTSVEVMGSLANDFDSKDEVEKAIQAQAELLATGEPQTREFQYTVFDRDISMLNTIFPIKNADGKIARIGGVSFDVTELHKTRNDLQQARASLQSIFDNVPAVLYLRELDGTFITVNKWGTNVIGTDDVSEIIGSKASTFDSPEEQEEANRVQKQLLTTGHPVTMEYHRQVSGRVMTVMNTIFPIKDNHGAIAKIGGFAIDVTELYNARNQLQRAQENLHQSEKLAALGQLLAGVAHELNNPLAVVLGRAAILQEKLKDTPHSAPLQKLRDAADRCARIVKTFLAMARQTGPRRQIVEVKDLIDSALEMTTYSLRKSNVTWHATPLTHNQMIEVDQDQIVQVLINLILNAQHALEERPENRTLDIKVDLSSDQQWLNIAVADNGNGVSENVAHRIFDPFFTTKPVGQGTGLGLSVCKSMVEAHGGKLILEPTLGGGATFKVSLPVGNIQSIGAGGEMEAETAIQSRGRILIIDDEVEIAAILADCLTPLGIECVIATDGLAGLQRLSESNFDAIFCDVSMPVMDGFTFYKKLQETNPKLADHLVFISGDVLHRDWVSLNSSVDRPIIEKPFDPQQIREVALQLLTPKGSK